MGVKKTCGPGSYCYFGEFQIPVPKEKVAIRSCLKQDPELPDTLGCVEVDSDVFKLRECWCNSNKCNKGSKNRGSGGNFITFLCSPLKKFSEVIVINCAQKNNKTINFQIFRLLGKSLHHNSIH